MPSKRARDLNVMLKDLGFLDGKPTSSYGNDTRNGVSLLQQRLRADGVYQGAPHGRFDDATRAALIADEQIPTYEA